VMLVNCRLDRSRLHNYSVIVSRIVSQLG
jgi:hypothetical protein